MTAIQADLTEFSVKKKVTNKPSDFQSNVTSLFHLQKLTKCFGLDLYRAIVTKISKNNLQ
jgi:hypothetical protein